MIQYISILVLMRSTNALSLFFSRCAHRRCACPLHRTVPFKGGRYLSDVWALDLATGAWTPLQLQPAVGSVASPFLPTAGHTVTAWQGKLYVLGGHTKVRECQAG